MKKNAIKEYLLNVIGRENARHMWANCVDWEPTLTAYQDALNEAENANAEYELRKPVFVDYDDVEAAFVEIAR